MQTHKIFAEAKSARSDIDREQLLDRLQDAAADHGATHFLATGLPMPNRPLDKLILRMNWAVNGPAQPALMLTSYDPVLRECLTMARPFLWQDDVGDADTDDAPSMLMRSVSPTGRVTLVAVPINGLHPFQGCVLFAGRGISLSDMDLLAFEFECQQCFRSLQQIGAIKQDRPGDLSERERRVVELTATGLTAAEVAEMLEISQRTVHAHLQNSSEKLNATNKTHTVVEAIRYGQISM